MAIVMVCLL